MKFLDEAKIYIQAGKGGDGCLSFRREKYIEFGGPNGGNGGKGGDVILKAVPNLNTLVDFRFQQHFKAEKGRSGEGCSRTGRSGEDLIIKIPTGTVVLAEDKRTVICDFDKDGEEFKIAKGGRGGIGNEFFKSSTNQAPRKTTKGKPGDEISIWLRLKLIADIGLIGLPNAGKSTLLSVLTKARPKIANYEFTTIHPNLGIVSGYEKELIIADLPGLIEGAAEGKGLGHRFLGHAERCRKIVHLIDAARDDIIKAYKLIRKELTTYGADLENKEEIIVLNKIDALNEDALAEVEKQAKKLKKETKNDVLLLSTVSRQGLTELKNKLLNS